MVMSIHEFVIVVHDEVRGDFMIGTFTSYDSAEEYAEMMDFDHYYVEELVQPE